MNGIKKFWERRIIPEKCAKYIDHVPYKAIPMALLGATVPYFVKCGFDIAL